MLHRAKAWPVRNARAKPANTYGKLYSLKLRVLHYLTYRTLEVSPLSLSLIELYTARCILFIRYIIILLNLLTLLIILNNSILLSREAAR